MLTMSGVSKAFGERVLFSEVDMQVNRGDRVALVGPNGAGKTTLLSVILDSTQLDAGQVAMPRGTTLGYLPQETAPVGLETVLELATMIHGANHHPALADTSADAAARAKRLLSNLGFRQKDYDRPAGELSGGWVMRAHLARLLVQEPDLLMLDEPTNHLDLETLLWFQEYLKNYPGAVLLISHDREFLNFLATSIVELRESRLMRYRGNYDEYLAQREAYEAQQLAAYKNQQREIGRLMLFVNRFRAKNTKATQAQSKLKQIARMDLVAAPGNAGAKMDFEFPQPERTGLKAISLSGVRHSYGPNVVYSHLDFEAQRGQRIVLVGPNGAGKSTLLKLLAGVMPVQQGERKLGLRVNSGYYSQYRLEGLDPERTVLEEASMTPRPATTEFIRKVLGGFLFRGDDVFKKVAVLSGGEKSRLALVKLLLDPPNLLLMDEPTTHLDISSVDALLAALDGFTGTLIFISHDVYFIRSLANHVVHVQDGRLNHFPGDYQYYLDKSAAQRAVAQANSAPAPVERSDDRPSVKAREQKRLEAEQRQARSRARKTIQETVSLLERQIQEAEKRHAELVALLESAETYNTPGKAMETNRELSFMTEQLESLNQEWETAATALQQVA